MGSESTHRQVREELARELAREHRVDLTRAQALLQRAERRAVDDPALRNVKQWFAVLLARDEARVYHERQVTSADAPGPMAPGRETLMDDDGLFSNEPSRPLQLDAAMPAHHDEVEEDAPTSPMSSEWLRTLAGSASRS